SRIFFAGGVFPLALRSLFSFTPQSATAFSPSFSFKFAAPRPPQPMTATLSLSIDAFERTMAGAPRAATPARAAPRKNPRRVIEYVSVGCMRGSPFTGLKRTEDGTVSELRLLVQGPR